MLELRKKNNNKKQCAGGKVARPSRETWCSSSCSACHARSASCTRRTSTSKSERPRARPPVRYVSLRRYAFLTPPPPPLPSILLRLDPHRRATRVRRDGGPGSTEQEYPKQYPLLGFHDTNLEVRRVAQVPIKTQIGGSDLPSLFAKRDYLSDWVVHTKSRLYMGLAIAFSLFFALSTSIWIFILLRRFVFRMLS